MEDWNRTHGRLPSSDLPLHSSDFCCSTFNFCPTVVQGHRGSIRLMEPSIHPSPLGKLGARWCADVLPPREVEKYRTKFPISGANSYNFSTSQARHPSVFSPLLTPFSRTPSQPVWLMWFWSHVLVVGNLSAAHRRCEKYFDKRSCTSRWRWWWWRDGNSWVREGVTKCSILPVVKCKFFGVSFTFWMRLEVNGWWLSTIAPVTDEWEIYKVP